MAYKASVSPGSVQHLQLKLQQLSKFLSGRVLDRHQVSVSVNNNNNNK
jgi:hypothetical protein